MNASLLRPRRALMYPDSDGQPMAENTLQFRWLVTIKEGLEAQFADDPNVFIAGDLFWYAVEGHPEIRTAPDVLAAFGPEKGDRGSYMQWEEKGVPPQVVFEILSPGNRSAEMLRRFEFYERFGVEEYYIYDPDKGDLKGWLRDGDKLKEIAQLDGWRSPRLQVRFELVNGELGLYHPDGSPFLTYVGLMKQWEQERERSTQERQRAEQERQRAEQADQRAEHERQRADALVAQLRALGIEPKV